MSSIANAKRTRLKGSIERVRTERFGPMPVNYLKTLREAQDLTLEAMAAKCGISKHALIRLEQGTYERILPSVLDYYVANYSDSELTLVDAYEEFQSAMRARHYQYFGLDLETNPAMDLHPFRQLRQRLAVTPTEVSKALCVPQATLVHFEKHIRQQQTVPKCVLNVFHEIGYKHEQIKGFQESYTEYRNRQTGKNIKQVSFS